VCEVVRAGDLLSGAGIRADGDRIGVAGSGRKVRTRIGVLGANESASGGVLKPASSKSVAEIEHISSG
jgi:hypothetical protein